MLATEGQNPAFPVRSVETVLLVFILGAAAALRLAAPGLTEFKADEARLLTLALNMAEGQGLALRGISSSVGFPNFPASVWLYAVPVAVWPHPYAATLFTGLLATLAVAACYWFARRYWGAAPALAAAALYAVSPWAVIFSRKIWAQDLLPLFVMGWVITAALAFVEERPRFLWLHLVCLALAVQIHLGALALLPVTLLLLVVFRGRVRWRDLLIGGGLAALTAVPFLVYLWQVRDQVGLPATAATSAAASAPGLASLRNALEISVGRDIHSLAGPAAFQAYLNRVPDLTLVQGLLALLIIGGGVLLVWRAWRQWPQKSAQAGFIAVLWMLGPILLFLLPWTPVYLHYFIPMLPAPFIAAGIAIAALPRLMGRIWPGSARWAALTVGAGLALILGLQVYVLVTLGAFLGSTATPGGFGVPLAYKLEAAAEVRALMVQSEAGEVLIAGSGEDPHVDEFPAEWSVLLRDVPQRFVDADRSALFPGAPAVVLLDSRDPSPTWTGDLYQRASSERFAVALRPGEGSYQVLALPGEARPQPQSAVDPPYLLANWVNLLGVDAPRLLGDGTAVWQVHWRSGDNPDPAVYHFFSHLQDGSGQRLAQADEPAFTSSQWRAGDTVISRFLLDWPETVAPPLSIRVGMYRYPALENVPLLDVAGNPYADAATFAVETLEDESS